MKKHTPFRDAIKDASDAAVLVFVGALVLGFINKSLDGLITVSVEKADDSDQTVG